MTVFHQRSMVEYRPGRWKMLGDLSVEEHEEMRELAGRGQILRHELAGMLERWADAIRSDPEFAAGGIPVEVSEACRDPNDLSFLRMQRAVDAMRAHLAALGLADGATR